MAAPATASLSGSSKADPATASPSGSLKADPEVSRPSSSLRYYNKVATVSHGDANAHGHVEIYPTRIVTQAVSFGREENRILLTSNSDRRNSVSGDVCFAHDGCNNFGSCPSSRRLVKTLSIKEVTAP